MKEEMSDSQLIIRVGATVMLFLVCSVLLNGLLVRTFGGGPDSITGIIRYVLSLGSGTLVSNTVWRKTNGKDLPKALRIISLVFASIITLFSVRIFDTLHGYLGILFGFVWLVLIWIYWENKNADESNSSDNED